MRKAFKPLTAIVAVVLAGLLLTACHHHRHGNHHDPEKMAERLEQHLEHVLDQVEATPQQRDEIRLVAEQIVEDARQLRSAGADDHGEMVAALLRDSPDRQELHREVDLKLQAMSEFAHRAVDRLIEISAVLTPEQRADLRKCFNAAHGDKS